MCIYYYRNKIYYLYVFFLFSQDYSTASLCIKRTSQGVLGAKHEGLFQPAPWPVVSRHSLVGGQVSVDKSEQKWRKGRRVNKTTMCMCCGCSELCTDSVCFLSFTVLDHSFSSVDFSNGKRKHNRMTYEFAHRSYTLDL